MHWFFIFIAALLIINAKSGEKWLNTVAKAGEVKLGEEQSRLVELLLVTKSNVFITGKAGTGKSLLLREFKRRTTKNSAVVAPTGIAALNAGGQTIHSLIGHKIDKAVLERLELLIIDEVSMVRADTIDNIDRRLREVKRCRKLFGGVQIVMFGDLYQLPPIVNDGKLQKYLYKKYGGLYFFQAKAWRTAGLEVYKLNKIYRQAGAEFQKILNAVREGKISNELLRQLNSRVLKGGLGDEIIVLCSTNKLVGEINMQRLERIQAKERVYKCSTTGRVKDNDFIAEDTLRLKVGAQIMMIRNDRNGRWVNGTIGQVAALKRSGVKVKIRNKVYSVERAKWQKNKYSVNQQTGNIIVEPEGTLEQFPVKLAWAVTIHKSQGQTFDKCAVDLKQGVFAPGQAYVALSRCKSLKGLYLLSPIMQSDITVPEHVSAFMKRVTLTY